MRITHIAIGAEPVFYPVIQVIQLDQGKDVFINIVCEL